MSDFVPIKFGLLGGRYVTITPDAIDVSALTLEDVARGLSRIPRFGGQTPEPYSVARHSVILADWMTKKQRYSRDDCRLALLHDAPEALGVNDIQHFIKQVYGLDLKALETRILRSLLPHFGVREEDVSLAAVEYHDKRLGAVEAAYFGWPPDGFRSDPDDPDLPSPCCAECDRLDWLAKWEELS